LQAIHSVVAGTHQADGCAECGAADFATCLRSRLPPHLSEQSTLARLKCSVEEARDSLPGISQIVAGGFALLKLAPPIVSKRRSHTLEEGHIDRPPITFGVSWVSDPPWGGV
jgi:hypothetical protein